MSSYLSLRSVIKDMDNFVSNEKKITDLKEFIDENKKIIIYYVKLREKLVESVILILDEIENERREYLNSKNFLN